MSEAQEISFGRNADAEVRKQYGVYKSAALQEYVNSVGQQIAKKSHRPNLQYHFTVLDTPEVNAFALPGGYVYITRGILAYLNSEAELAAVLGHEIGHVTARHGVRQASAELAANIGLSITSILVPEINSAAGQNLSNILGGALFAGYGRDHELEADRLGAEYLARTGYDPHAMIEVIDVLKHQELLDAEIARQEGREPRHYHGLFA
ncbi:MAG: M48 family metalloprotease, partial [Betaproteobacteria bacterium]|nr:M48 family metalloprotease [Betaproteobacteria bacterium]